MPTTPSLAIPYPAPSAAPDVPYDMQQLAENLDATFASTRPRCGLSQTTLPSLVSGTATALSWDTEAFDVGAMHSTGTNPTRIIATKAGLYMVTTSTEIGTFAAGYMRLQFKYNGATFGEATTVPQPNATHQITLTTLWQAVLNDYLEVIETQTTGGNKTPVSNTFKAVWLCP